MWLLAEDFGEWPTPHTGRETAGRRALHFDGRQWSQAPLPPAGDELAVISPDDAIAVGTDGKQLSAERWDGRMWTPMRVPVLRVGDRQRYEFTDVHANAADDVWAVGGLVDIDGLIGVHAAVPAHWNGAEWKVSVDRDLGSYTSVTGDGAGGLWLTRAEGAHSDVFTPEHVDVGGGVVHRDAQGAMTDHDLDAEAPPDRHYVDAEPNPIEETALSSVPGIAGLAVVGTLAETSDGDPVSERGAVRFCTR